MNAHGSIEIQAPHSVVWQNFADVERWPEWTPSVANVDRIRGEGLAPGVTVRIRVEQQIDQTGVLGRPVGWLLSSKTRRFLRQEAVGLKERCESR